MGVQSLSQQSALRLTSSTIVEFAPHITLTNIDFRFIVGEQLQAVGIDPGTIIIESAVKNTTPTMLATFEITPTHPETGYGYLVLSGSTVVVSDVEAVSRFVEKPDLENADRVLKLGNYLRNAGIFLFLAWDMVDAVETFDSATLNLVTASVKEAKVAFGFLGMQPAAWSGLIPDSIDYAVMEKVDNLVAVAYKSKWSDLGGWDAVWADAKKDENGNAVSEAAHAIAFKNSLLRSENPSQQLVGLGLDKISVILIPNAVLVAIKGRAQDFKKVADHLKENAIPQAEVFPKDYRPWGWFESLVLSDGFQLKRIYVNLGSAFSLQSHKHRSEHCIVVEGVAKVTIDETVMLVAAGEIVYVPQGAIHRMENTSTLPVILVGVQIGNYLGEDDVVRYEDAYART